MNIYKCHRFPPDIISYAVWLYFRFNLSHRDSEYLLAQRGIIVSYESVRLWCIRFGQKYANRLKRRHTGYGDTFYIDEIFVKINVKQQFLWRAVDQESKEPRQIVTDKLRSYGVAQRELIPETVHNTAQYANNRAEMSHQPTRVSERGMRRFKSTAGAVLNRGAWTGYSREGS